MPCNVRRGSRFGQRACDSKGSPGIITRLGGQCYDDDINKDDMRLGMQPDKTVSALVAVQSVCDP